MGNDIAPRFLSAGETALIVEYGRTIDPLIHDRVMALDAAISAAPVEGIVETVPTYRSLMIHFDPRATTPEALIQKLAVLDTTRKPGTGKARRWRIPVCYDPSLAEDMAEVSASLHLPQERIAALHAGTTYRVYMYGFAPGFTFLGGLPDELAISRRATPRLPAPQGSLLIAGGQALITTIAMPTGWYVIGQTPVRMFDPSRARPFLVDVGDEIIFEPIDLTSFEPLRRAAEEGSLVAREETA
jgi:inhibitor of KinA